MLFTPLVLLLGDEFKTNSGMGGVIGRLGGDGLRVDVC